MTVLALALALGLHAAQAAPEPDLIKPAWFDGRPVNMNVLLPARQGGAGPDAPAPERPDLTVYLTAPLREQPTQMSRVFTIPTEDGPKVLPPHDDVLARLVPRDDPADAMGYFVVPGPHAGSRVLVQTDPADSVIGAPLAYAVKHGDQWLELTSHRIIEAGVESGVLALIEFESGGLQWTTEIEPSG